MLYKIQSVRAPVLQPLPVQRVWDAFTGASTETITTHQEDCTRGNHVVSWACCVPAQVECAQQRLPAAGPATRALTDLTNPTMDWALMAQVRGGDGRRGWVGGQGRGGRSIPS